MDFAKATREIRMIGENMIESMQNKLVKQIIGLQRRREREKTQTFVAEGIKFVGEIPKDWEIQSYVISQTFEQEKKGGLGEYEDRAPVFTVTDAIFRELSDTQTPQGILAICKQRQDQITNIMEKEKPFLILVEEMQDPGNLGTLIRTADAAGADGVIVSKGSVDLYNPKVLRSTMGSLFHLPIIQGADIIEMMKNLQKNNIPILAAHLKGEQMPYEIDLRNPVALLIGNEANGISEEAASRADLLTKLPMMGQAESLNAAIASGILMYEVVRQRLR